MDITHENNDGGNDDSERHQQAAETAPAATTSNESMSKQVRRKVITHAKYIGAKGKSPDLPHPKQVQVEPKRSM